MANYVSLDDAAKILGVSSEELVDMRSRGEIFGYRDGTSWKFKEEEIDRVRAELAGDVMDEDAGGSSILISERQSEKSGSKPSAGGSDIGLGSDLKLMGDDSRAGSDVKLVADPASGSGFDWSRPTRIAKSIWDRCPTLSCRVKLDRAKDLKWISAPICNWMVERGIVALTLWRIPASSLARTSSLVRRAWVQVKGLVLN